MAPRGKDANAEAAALAHQQQLTKPQGALGQLEELAVQLAGIQQTVWPAARPASAILFAADHPVCKHGVSAYPQAVTAAMVSNIVQGGAACSVLARAAGVPLHVVDVGVLRGEEEGKEEQVADGITFTRAKQWGSVGDLRTEDAMDQAAFDAAWSAGEAAVQELSAEVCVLVLGEMGIGNTTPAAAVAACLLGRPAADLVGRGTGVDDAGMARKAQVVSDAVARVLAATPVAAEAAAAASGQSRSEGGHEGPAGILPVPPLEVLRLLGGRELTAIAGAALAGAARGQVILVDGYIVTAAILAATRHEPRLREHLVFAHRSQELGHHLMLEALCGKPLLDLGLRLGEGSGALLAFGLLEQACALHRGMATFEGAKVPDRDPQASH